MVELPDIEQPIVEFVPRVQHSMALSDAPALTRLFAPQSLEATPSETRKRTNDATSLAAREERFSYLLLAGMRDVKALQIDPTQFGDALDNGEAGLIVVNAWQRNPYFVVHVL